MTRRTRSRACPSSGATARSLCALLAFLAACQEDPLAPRHDALGGGPSAARRGGGSGGSAGGATAGATQGGSVGLGGASAGGSSGSASGSGTSAGAGASGSGGAATGGTSPAAGGAGGASGDGAGGSGGGTSGSIGVSGVSGRAGSAGSAGGAGAGGVAGTGGTSASVPPIDPNGPIFGVSNGLYDASRPNDLGLSVAAGTETSTVFAPTAGSDHFSNGVVVIGFKGNLYAQWQSSATDEDAPGTWVAYARSADGLTWSPPMTLAPAWNEGLRTSGGWWTDGNTLVAYINVWPATVTPRGGHVEYATSSDGTIWSDRQRVLMAGGAPLDGIFEQDPHALPDGRILGAAHFQPGLVVAPCYTDDPLGVSGWTRSTFQNLAHSGTVSRELEPSWFRRTDGSAVMVFRDQNNSYRRLASLSVDRGATFTTPVETNMPDSRSKQSAGNLPNGVAFQVGNPVADKTRFPLVVSLSQNGQTFDRAFALRRGGDDLPAQRYAGSAKTLGYSYPKSTVWGEHLYVAYSTNKEDVEVTRVPLSSLSY